MALFPEILELRGAAPGNPANTPQTTEAALDGRSDPHRP
jgi:hypothetical protein